MKVREVLRLVAKDGWVIVRQTGSHRHFKHATKPGLVTVAGKEGDEMHPKTLSSIARQAGIEIK